MMNPIVHSDFLLESKYAQELYHNYAAQMPIIDYHCHLSPEEIANNIKFENITQLWLKGDHYKWRAMRTNGVQEKYITGNANDAEKFQKWAETVPNTLRNPLFHWTHLELKKPFGIRDLLNGENASNVYRTCNELLTTDEFSARGLIQQFNVEKLCTTDDPIDNLEHHKAIRESKLEVKVSMAWRPDRMLDMRSPHVFNDYVNALSVCTNKEIVGYTDYLDAIRTRHDYFHANGCRIADHGLEEAFPVESYTEQELNTLFAKIRNNKEITYSEQRILASALLYELAVLNNEKGWVQQFHVGALRDVNQTAVQKIGQACGFDSIHDFNWAASMGSFLNRLEENGMLTKTIIYNLNPKDNEMVAAMIANFQDGTVPGKIQYGSGWWFLDQMDGMERQLNALSNIGLISQFIGMLTDSRCLISYSRHEYFRRILCNLLGNDMQRGIIPPDIKLVGKMVQNICYHNADNYFDF